MGNVILFTLIGYSFQLEFIPLYVMNVHSCSKCMNYVHTCQFITTIILLSSSSCIGVVSRIPTKGLQSFHTPCLPSWSKMSRRSKKWQRQEKMNFELWTCVFTCCGLQSFIAHRVHSNELGTFIPPLMLRAIEPTIIKIFYDLVSCIWEPNPLWRYVD